MLENCVTEDSIKLMVCEWQQFEIAGYGQMCSWEPQVGVDYRSSAHLEQ